MKSTHTKTTTSRKKGKHITDEERQIIEKLYRKHVPVAQIADLLDVHRSTIYRELQLGRVTHLNSELISFSTYSADRASDEHKHIIRIQLERVSKRLAARGLKMELSDAAAELVADHGYDPVYGARPLKRAIQHDLLDPLSMAILAGKYPEGATIRIDAKDGSICFN